MKNKPVCLLACLLLLGGAVALSAADAVKPADEYPQLKFAGFTRLRYTVDFAAGKTDGFSLAQLRFGISGALSKFFTYNFNIEGTNADGTNNKLVYDAFIDSTIVPLFKIRFGQFKYAFGLEQTTADPDLELINKADVVVNLVKPARDIGLQVSREFAIRHLQPSLALGLINGSGSNADDDNTRKAIVGRLLLKPAKGLAMGVSLYDGTTSVANDKKSRLGFELKFEARSLLLKGEFITGKDKTVKKDGFYATAAYTLPKSNQLLVRYDRWNADKAIAGRDVSRLTFAVNHFFGKRVVWQTNFELRTETPKIKNDIFVTQIQIRL